MGDSAARANADVVAMDAKRVGPQFKWLRRLWLRRHHYREVCWFCHADYAGRPCPTCGWAPLRHVVFVDQDGKRYTNEVGASNGDPWLWALITMPGMGGRIALPLEVQSA